MLSLKESDFDAITLHFVRLHWSFDLKYVKTGTSQAPTSSLVQRGIVHTCQWMIFNNGIAIR